MAGVGGRNLNFMSKMMEMEMCAELEEHAERVRRFREEGVCASVQALLMLVAAADEAPRMSDAGRKLAISPAAMTALADRLVQRGLLEREVVAGDRRAIAVVLTDAGYDLLRRGIGVRDLWVEGGAV